MRTFFAAILLAALVAPANAACFYDRHKEVCYRDNQGYLVCQCVPVR